MEMSASELKNIIKECDFHNNHKINYSEFIGATINLKEYLTIERLEAIFY